MNSYELLLALYISTNHLTRYKIFCCSKETENVVVLLFYVHAKQLYGHVGTVSLLT